MQCPKVFIAIVLLVQWSYEVKPKYDLVELFSGKGNVGQVWREAGLSVGQYDWDESRRGMNFLSCGGFATAIFMVLCLLPFGLVLLGPDCPGFSLPRAAGAFTPGLGTRTLERGGSAGLTSAASAESLATSLQPVPSPPATPAPKENAWTPPNSVITKLQNFHVTTPKEGKQANEEAPPQSAQPEEQLSAEDYALKHGETFTLDDTHPDTPAETTPDSDVVMVSSSPGHIIEPENQLGLESQPSPLDSVEQQASLSVPNKEVAQTQEGSSSQGNAKDEALTTSELKAPEKGTSAKPSSSTAAQQPEPAKHPKADPPKPAAEPTNKYADGTYWKFWA
eukprot:Skav233998  [mRNA]  locus=scaffold2413:218954:222547:+ [translate_table: standard]